MSVQMKKSLSRGSKRRFRVRRNRKMSQTMRSCARKREASEFSERGRRNMPTRPKRM